MNYLPPAPKQLLFPALLFVFTIPVLQAQEYGYASSYPKWVQGAQTSYGEFYDLEKLTCSHRTYPYNSILRVTNRANQKSVRVRVNDSGPYEEERLIDLTTVAADKIGLKAGKVVEVKVELIARGRKKSATRNTMPSAKQPPIAKASAAETDLEKIFFYLVIIFIIIVILLFAILIKIGFKGDFFKSLGKQTSQFFADIANFPLQFILLLCISLFFILLFFGLATVINNAQKNQNRQVLKYNPTEYRELEMPNFDPLMDENLDYLRGNDYSLTSVANSREVERILNDNPQLATIVKDRKFYSLKDLLKFLVINGNYGAEIEVINYVAGQESSVPREVFQHVKSTYLSPIRASIKNNQFGALKMASNDAYFKVNDIDISPEDGGWLINEILFAKILFDDPLTLHLNTDQILKYYDIAKGNFRPGIRSAISEMDTTGELKYLSLYWESVYLFRGQRYDQCIANFKRIIEESHNFILKDLSRLMVVRSLYWFAYNTKVSDEKEIDLIIQEIKQLKEDIFKFSFKTDVDFYMDQLIEIHETAG